MTDNLERVEKIILNMDCNKTDNISNRSSSSKRVIINLSKQSNITNSSNETIQLKKKSINEENYNSNKIKVAVKINNEMKLKNFNSNDTRKAIPKDHNHKKQVDLLIQKMRSLREEELKKKQLQKTINRENNVNYIQINFYTNKSDKASKETSLRKVKCDKDTTEKVSFNAAFNNESSKIKLSKSRSTISKKKVDRDITPKPNMIFNNKSKYFIS